MSKGLAERAESLAPRLSKIRRQIHMHPELGFNEHRTAGKVAEVLTEFGWRVKTGVGKTGVIGELGSGKPVIGICNGFQALVKAGWLPGRLLPGPLAGGVAGGNGVASSREATLTFNASNRFECRWVWLDSNPDSPCVFTRRLAEPIYCPVAHGEGRSLFPEPAVLDRVLDEGLAPGASQWLSFDLAGLLPGAWLGNRLRRQGKAGPTLQGGETLGYELIELGGVDAGTFGSSELLFESVSAAFGRFRRAHERSQPPTARFAPPTPAPIATPRRADPASSSTPPRPRSSTSRPCWPTPAWSRPRPRPPSSTTACSWASRAP